MINQKKLMTNRRFVNTILDTVVIGGTKHSDERDKEVFKVLQEEGFLSKSVERIRLYAYLEYRAVTPIDGFNITIVEDFESYTTRRTVFYFTKEFIEGWWA